MNLNVQLTYLLCVHTSGFLIQISFKGIICSKCNMCKGLKSILWRLTSFKCDLNYLNIFSSYGNLYLNNNLYVVYKFDFHIKYVVFVSVASGIPQAMNI